MVFALFRRSGNRRTIDRLHAAIIAAARQEVLYRDYGVADTVDGRFEMLVLHAALLVRRLNACPAPGPDMAQDLTDALFRHLDSTLREAGIGDTSVPKRMKKLAAAFFGRANAYAGALAAGDADALVSALERNVYAGRPAADAAHRLARHVQATVAHLETVPVDAFLSEDALFPDAVHTD